MNEPVERLAAIDVGSNTVLLLIAEYRPTAGLTIIAEAEDQPRLGAGLAATGRLSQAAMARALETLERMRELCRAHGVSRIEAVATAAVREAANGDEFVQGVRAKGIPLHTISAETEAALSYRSAAHHFPVQDRMLVADIGGGSLELIGSAQGRVQLTRSLPLGAVRLTELGLPLPTLREHIRHLLTDAMVDRSWAGSKAVGSGGTFTTLASMVLAQRGFPPGPIHGTEIGTPDIERLLTELAAMSREQREMVAGLPGKRADIIVAGLAVAAEVLDRVAAAEVTVTGYGVREGMLLELAGEAP